ncbi:hypothetical protein [Nostoc sp.]|uniref:hypothetical protein n=1 Tax=Nostoc sp. TaxID=1180 RepID=UPI002FF6F447
MTNDRLEFVQYIGALAYYSKSLSQSQRTFKRRSDPTGGTYIILHLNDVHPLPPLIPPMY